jgi:hypothetical protein
MGMSKILEKYLLNYKGIKDPFRRTLLILKESFQIERVLYPGSWIHLTPSLVFPFVVYVDFLPNTKKMLEDSELLEYIRLHSENSEPCIKKHETDYRKGIEEEKESFDLLISLNSGLVSQYCSQYLKKDGLLLANNEHYDAIKAFTEKNFRIMGVFSNFSELEQKNLEEYFMTRNNQLITSEMVTENIKKPPSKAKYKLRKKALYYLFKKSI